MGNPSRLPCPLDYGGRHLREAGVVDGQIAIREYLSLTLSFDHETIDGAPAARFTQRLIDLIERGYGLFDSTVESGQAEAEAASLKSKR